ncbi:MAG TPA: hypothetical protein VGB15_03020, partial [Longimicrobium sp.]
RLARAATQQTAGQRPLLPAATGTATRAAQQDSLAAALAASPVANVYVVPANTGDQGRIEAVRRRVGTGVRVVDLTLCYGKPGTEGCWADVPGTRYRLVGVPTLPDSAKRDPITMAKLETLLAEAKQADRRVVLVAGSLPAARSHGRAPAAVSPPAPATAADSARADSVAAAQAAAAGARPPNAGPPREWGDVVAGGEVAALLSGTAAGTPASRRLLLAPPLGGRGGEPVPTRGFGVVSLPRATLATVGYDDARRSFEPLPSAQAMPREPRPGALGRFLRWARSLLDSPRDMAFATVFAIALLFAFLTVAALWRPDGEPKAMVRAESSAGGAGATQARTSVSTSVPGGAIFEGNLARTVWSGLTGIATVTLLTQFWNFSGVNSEALYVVVFVAAFLAFLVASALMRAVVEALRSRVLASRPVPTWRPPVRPEAMSDAEHRRLVRAHRGVHLRMRMWRWFLSLRDLFLVFFDTFMNVVMGRSYAANVVWEDKIVDMQRMVLRTTDRVREEISTALQQALINSYDKSRTHPQPPAGGTPGQGGASTPAPGSNAAPGTPGQGSSAGPGAGRQSSSAETGAGTGGGSSSAGTVAGTDAQSSSAGTGAVTGGQSSSAGTGAGVEGENGATGETGTTGETTTFTPGTGAQDSAATPPAEGGETQPANGGAVAPPADPATAATTTAPAVDPEEEDDIDLADPDDAALTILQQGIRVAISVVSDDGQSLFYISTDGGSLAKQFGKTSVAWVAASAGEARWWTGRYDKKNVVLFDNSVGKTLPGLEGVKLRLDDYFQHREAPDYRAFLLLPIPWRRRDLPENTRRAMIHISFARRAWLKRLWPNIHKGLDAELERQQKAGGSTVDIDPYTAWRALLNSDASVDPSLRAVLQQSVNVLSEVVAEFDQTIYEWRLRRLRGG